jgi:hypothetical protein
VIKKVHINMCPILDGYGVLTVFSFPYTPSCEPRLSSGQVAIFSQLIISTLERYLRHGALVCPPTASLAPTGVQNSSHLGASVTSMMPFTFS